jgi:hypothetical protein
MSIYLKYRNIIRNTSLMRYLEAVTRNAIEALDIGPER